MAGEVAHELCLTWTQYARSSTSALLARGWQVPNACETTCRHASSSSEAISDWKNVHTFWIQNGEAPAAGLASYVTTYTKEVWRT